MPKIIPKYIYFIFQSYLKLILNFIVNNYSIHFTHIRLIFSIFRKFYLATTHNSKINFNKNLATKIFI